ncbi:hypothetical protein QVA66_09805 [Staphylococcus chromogenes]|nr:hypothetical protein [Staphylococcus chromogenes]
MFRKKAALVLACMAGMASVTAPIAVAETNEPVTAVAPAQSNVEAVRQAQEEYRQTATPGEYAAAMRAYEELLTTGSISKIDSTGESGTASRGIGCLVISKSAIVAYAWKLKLSGVAVGVGGLLLDETIVGLPAGVVLGAIGAGATVGADGLLYWADHTDWPKHICV